MQKMILTAHKMKSTFTKGESVFHQMRREMQKMILTARKMKSTFTKGESVFHQMRGEMQKMILTAHKMKSTFTKTKSIMHQSSIREDRYIEPSYFPPYWMYILLQFKE